MSESECIFCQIVKKNIPSKIVFENDKIIAFLDIFPINNGHTIIIPKTHYKNLEEIPENEFTDVFKIVKDIAIMIHKKLQIDGYNIIQNNFEAAGQAIQHFHVHIIPRSKDDKKFKLMIPKEQASEEELNKILFSLKN